MKTKSSVQHPRAYARGGDDRMFPKQAAGPQKPGGPRTTSKAARLEPDLPRVVGTLVDKV